MKHCSWHKSSHVTIYEHMSFVNICVVDWYMLQIDQGQVVKFCTQDLRLGVIIADRMGGY